MKELKENAFTGFFVWDDGTSKQGRLILEFKDLFKIYRLWEVANEDNSENCYYISSFLGKNLICPVCKGDLCAPDRNSYKELHQDGCTISFENALEIFKSSKPDLTKDWDFGDVYYLSLENAMASLIYIIAQPKSEFFIKWTKEIGKIQDDIQRKEDKNYNKWVEMMEEMEPGFTNY